MADYSGIDRHVLSFKGSPFVNVQRDVKFVAGSQIVNQLSYYFSYEGQIKEIVFDMDSLNVDFNAVKERIANGKGNAQNYEISKMTADDGSTVIMDFEFGLLMQFKIEQGVLNCGGETFANQEPQMQLDLKAFRIDTSLRVSN